MKSIYDQIVESGELYLYISQADSELLPTGSYWIDLADDVTVTDNEGNTITTSDDFVFSLSEALEEIIAANDERLVMLQQFKGIEPIRERAVEFLK